MKKNLFVFINIFFIVNSFATSREVNLVVEYKTVNFAGEPIKAIAVNNQIPAPTLHFKKGDHVTINVYNKLDQETAIHWHGIILPWQMDGVLGINQHGIPPGGVFKYQFILHQSGTYWYHAHAGLQEQQGLYGAFLIDPPNATTYKYDKDYVVVLSDWSNTHPDKILANLKKDGDYYSPNFPLQPSLTKFIYDYQKGSAAERQQLIDDYKMMQEMRMSIYDISDIAYDAFLLNGQSKSKPWTAPVKVGDIVRLRFIGAGGSSIFHVKIPGSEMQMAHVNGNDVQPYSISDFTIAPGETFDVLVKIQEDKPYIIYAESMDTVGAVYGALLTSPHQFVDFERISKFPEPEPVTREMMAMMMGKAKHGLLPKKGEATTTADGMQKMSHDKPAKHSTHTMPNTDHSQHQSMPQNSMKMDSSMMMDKNMPMNHSMPMDHQKNQSKSATTNKKSQDVMKAEDSSLHQQNSHDMHSMPMISASTTEQSSKHQSILNPSTKMESSMKMDKNMPMSVSHHMPMEHKEKQNKSLQHRQISNTNHHDMGSMTMAHDAKSSTMQDHMPMSGGMKMDHKMANGPFMDMSMPTEPTIIGDSIALPNSSYTTSYGTKYENLIAAVKTNDPSKPVTGVIKMELFGYMDKFIWFINGVPEYNAKPIVLQPGKRYRLVFTNTSMMHHPMHIHGHWFILRKGNDEYDPLLHTIDVAPGATITADIDTDASGQWLFHCHMLYHMMSGMSRVIQYSSLIEINKKEAKPQNITEQTSYYNRPIVRVDEITPIDNHLVQHPMAHHMNLFLANFMDIGEDPFHNIQKINYKGFYGLDYNKLQLFIDDAEINKGHTETADIDIFYWQLINQFWAIKGGANYFYRPTKTPYWQPGIGIEGLMPYYIDTNVRGYYYRGSAKLDVALSRDTQITNNLFIRTGIRSILASKTVKQASLGNGLNQMSYVVRPYYRLMPGLNIFAEYEYERSYGTLKNLQVARGENVNQNIITLGLAFLF